MSDARRALGLSRPGTWIARVAMPPPVLSAWGWTWRLVARWIASTVVIAIGALGFTASIDAGRLDWFELVVWTAGLGYSLLLTVGVTVAFARRKRA